MTTLYSEDIARSICMFLNHKDINTFLQIDKTMYRFFDKLRIIKLDYSWSYLYVTDKSFRAEINLFVSFPRKQIILNLGHECNLRHRCFIFEDLISSGIKIDNIHMGNCVHYHKQIYNIECVDDFLFRKNKIVILDNSHKTFISTPFFTRSVLPYTYVYMTDSVKYKKQSNTQLEIELKDIDIHFINILGREYFYRTRFYRIMNRYNTSIIHNIEEQIAFLRTNKGENIHKIDALQLQKVIRQNINRLLSSWVNNFKYSIDTFYMSAINHMIELEKIYNIDISSKKDIISYVEEQLSNPFEAQIDRNKLIVNFGKKYINCVELYTEMCIDKKDDNIYLEDNNSGSARFCLLVYMSNVYKRIETFAVSINV
jgi:hypothetical protein